VIQALQALRGIREITAVTLVAEVGQSSRFRRTFSETPLAQRQVGSGSS